VLIEQETGEKRYKRVKEGNKLKRMRTNEEKGVSILSVLSNKKSDIFSLNYCTYL
jgi:uncharacterized protein YkuJ